MPCERARGRAGFARRFTPVGDVPEALRDDRCCRRFKDLDIATAHLSAVLTPAMQEPLWFWKQGRTSDDHRGKTREQQAVLMVHKARQLAMARRTALVNQIHGDLGEFGIVAPTGPKRLRGALPGILEDAENGRKVRSEATAVYPGDHAHPRRDSGQRTRRVTSEGVLERHWRHWWKSGLIFTAVKTECQSTQGALA